MWERGKSNSIFIQFYILMTLTQIYLLAFNSAKWIFQNIASY